MPRVFVLIAVPLLCLALLLLGCSGGESSEQQQRQEPQASQQVRQDDQEQSAQPAQQVEPAEQVQSVESEQTDQPVAPKLDAAEETKLVIGGERTATLLLPSGVDRREPRPLIVLLHGYGSNSVQADQYFQFSRRVDAGGFGLLLPDGTVDEIRNQFWNGTPECCDIFAAEPDDVSYIRSLIEEAQQVAAFDPIFAVGHSNGGFMAYRLACEEIAGLTAIVSLAGAAFADPGECRSPAPLSVLQIHGTKDQDVLYEGGRLPEHPDPDRAAAPGARDSVLRWAERAGCDRERSTELPRIDTDTAVAGEETSVVRWSEGCREGTVMELWTIEGGGHIPLVWGTDFTPGILKWLLERSQAG